MNKQVENNTVKVVYYQASKYTRLSNVPKGLSEEAIIFNNTYGIDTIAVHGSSIETMLKYKENNILDLYLDGRFNYFYREMQVRIEDYIFLYVFQSAYYYADTDKTHVRYELQYINSYA